MKENEKSGTTENFVQRRKMFSPSVFQINFSQEKHRMLQVQYIRLCSINKFVQSCCVFVTCCGCTWGVWRALEKLELL